MYFLVYHKRLLKTFLILINFVYLDKVSSAQLIVAIEVVGVHARYWSFGDFKYASTNSISCIVKVEWSNCVSAVP